MRDENILLVIFANNEEAVIGHAVTNLIEHSRDRAEVHVVADHCSDATAEVADRFGAVVYRRDGVAANGKGMAIDWWLRQTHAGANPRDIIIVFDADTAIAPNFLPRILQRFDAGENALQVLVEPNSSDVISESKMAAISETIEHRVYDRIKGGLGISVRLRGNGMAFRRTVLERHSHRLHTVVEDIELSILLAVEGTSIAYEPHTCVYDMKPDHKDDIVRQRARWLKGQWQILREYPRELLQLMTRGVSGWSIFSSCMFRPKSFFLPLKVLLLGMLLFASAMSGGAWNFWVLLSVLLSFSLLLDIAAILYGLRILEDDLSIKDLVRLVFAFLRVWLRSLVLAVMTKETWLRSRPISLPQAIRDPGRIQ